jgi:hypothetical protein
MNRTLPQAPLQNRQIRQSIFTLVLFLVTFFAHSEHFTQVETDSFSAFELHDCNLCQQGIDSPPAAIELNPVNEIVFFLDDTQHANVILYPNNYVFQRLRAPPTFL